MQECEAAAFLLTGLARWPGEWHAALPGSVAGVRRAASAFVALAALPSARSSMTVHCEPVSPEEVVGARLVWPHACCPTTPCGSTSATAQHEHGSSCGGLLLGAMATASCAGSLFFT